MYQVIFNVKNTDKAHRLYNVLDEKVKKFDSLKEAFEFACRIKNNGLSAYERLIGDPVVERMESHG